MNYTTIEQSKKLLELGLSPESADMFYMINNGKESKIPYVINVIHSSEAIPCWSLAALFRLLPKSAQLEKGNVTELYRVILPIELKASDWYVEPVDACYELILKLHELKMF